MNISSSQQIGRYGWDVAVLYFGFGGAAVTVALAVRSIPICQKIRVIIVKAVANCLKTQ